MMIIYATLDSYTLICWEGEMPPTVNETLIIHLNTGKVKQTCILVTTKKVIDKIKKKIKDTFWRNNIYVSPLILATLHVSLLQINYKIPWLNQNKSQG